MSINQSVSYFAIRKLTIYLLK